MTPSPLLAADRYPVPVDALVHANLAAVRRVAWHVHVQAGGVLEVADLVQIGLIALVEAARSTRQTDALAFASYARTRVRGAMIDEVRRAAPQTRGAMARRQRIARARSALAARLGRAPTPPELADELDWPVARLMAEEVESAAVRFEPIDAADADAAPFADDAPDALAQLLEREDGERLADGIARLGERHRTVLQLYFVDELNLAEIGQVLGVSTPRVHQLKADALAKLRALVS